MVFGFGISWGHLSLVHTQLPPWLVLTLLTRSPWLLRVADAAIQPHSSLSLQWTKSALSCLQNVPLGEVSNVKG